SYNARKKGVDDFTDSSSNLEDEYDDEEYGREDLIESLMILALCLLVGYLVYLRQLRWNQAENNRIAADQANNANNAARFGWAGAGGD
ncbi:7278_t:CDS:2, partial [Funneliformis mosseae]